MGSKGFQNTLFAVLFIIVGIATSMFVVNIPEKQDQSTVESSGISRNFDVETFEGWVFTLDTLERQQEVLYGPEPNPNSEDSAELERAEVAERRGYPKQYLPSLIQEYGIAVQKDYSGNYLFQAHKEKMIEFLNNELVLLSEAMTLFKPTSDPINANDAVVLKAIEKYTLLLEALNTNVSSITYADVNSQSIGEIIQGGLTEEDFSEPLAYGMLATEHLKNNIRAHQARYFALDDDDPSLAPPNLKQVANILGVDHNTGEAKKEE